MFFECRRHIGFSRSVYVIVGLIFLLLITTPLSAQKRNKRYKGSYSQNAWKYNGGKRRKPKYKNVKNKAARKQIKQRSKATQARHKRSVKAHRGGGKHIVSKQTKSTKKRRYTGKFPSSKNQFGTKAEAIATVGAILNNKLASTNNYLIDDAAGENEYGLDFSLGAIYHLSNNIGLKACGRYYVLPKDNSRMTIYGGAVGFKFNILSYKNKVSPYVYAGGSIYQWSYNRKDFSEQISGRETPDEGTNFVEVTVVERNYESYSSGTEYLYGMKLGGGFDIQINSNFGIQIEGGYNYAQNFTNNNIAITFDDKNFYFDIGIKYSLLKNKSLY